MNTRQKKLELLVDVVTLFSEAVQDHAIAIQSLELCDQELKIGGCSHHEWVAASVVADEARLRSRTLEEQYLRLADELYRARKEGDSDE